jgi:hypothetical protein
MLDFVYKFGYDIYSQNGEDGIIKEAMFRINPDMRVAVEFGGVDGIYCSNTAALGWSRHLYDINPKDILVHKKEITPENVNELPGCELLSIDIDGNDYNIWKAYNGKPAVVIIEINSSLNPDVEFFQPERGASFITMLRLGIEKGYFLLCHTGNMIFVSNEYKELFPDIDEVTTELFFNKSWL